MVAVEEIEEVAKHLCGNDRHGDTPSPFPATKPTKHRNKQNKREQNEPKAYLPTEARQLGMSPRIEAPGTIQNRAWKEQGDGGVGSRGGSRDEKAANGQDCFA